MKKNGILLTLILVVLFAFGLKADSEIIIGILEEGVALDHPFFAGRVIGFSIDDVKDLWNVNENDWWREKGRLQHGTRIAGTILKYNPLVVVKSVNNNLFPDDYPTSHYDQTAWDDFSECNIINIAFGAFAINDTKNGWDIDFFSKAHLRESLSSQYIDGKLIVVAAGNHNEPYLYDPSNYGFFTVGSAEPYVTRYIWWGDDHIDFEDFDGQIYSLPFGSNHAIGLDIVAPAGRDLIHGVPNWEPTYNYVDPGEVTYNAVNFGATSGASAIVSALAAKLWSKFDYLDPSDIEQIFKMTASDIETEGFDEKTGYGLIDYPAAENFCNDFLVIKRKISMNEYYKVYPPAECMLYLNGINPIPAWKYTVIQDVDLSEDYGVTPWYIWGSSHYPTTSGNLPSEGWKNTTYQYKIPYPFVRWNEENRYNFTIEATYFKLSETGEWCPKDPNNAVLGYTIVMPKVPASNVYLKGRLGYIVTFDDIGPEGDYNIYLTTKMTYGTFKKGLLHYYQIYNNSTDAFQTIYQTYNDEYIYKIPVSSFDSKLYFRVKVLDKITEGGLYSNTVIMWPPVDGDPIVQYTDKTDATGYANGRKIVVDSLENIHVIYTKSDSVFYTVSSDDGEQWNCNEFIGQGHAPAINLLNDGTPVICWVNNNNIHSKKKIADNWDTESTIYSSTTANIEFLCFETDVFDNSYLGWVEDGPEGSKVNISDYDSRETGAVLAPTPIDEGGQHAFKCPSISIKANSDIVISWSKNGEIYYYDNETGKEKINSIEGIGEHPIISSYGDRISVIWREQLYDGTHKIVKRTKTDIGWKDIEVIRENETKELNYPYVVNGCQYLFSEENELGDKDIIHLGEFKGGWITEYQNISLKSGGDSYHPSAYYRQNWPKGKLYMLWTEDMSINQENTKGLPISIPIKLYVKNDMKAIEYIYADCGTEMGNIYNIQKFDTIYYNNLPEYTVDYDNYQLSYKFTSLNPGKRYKIKFVFYQKSGETVSQRIGIDARVNKVKKIYNDKITELEEWIPNSCIRDGEIRVDVSKVSGPYAVCSEIILYEFEKNNNEEENNNLKNKVIISNNLNNITISGSKINFKVSTIQKVQINVYNLLGQQIITIPNKYYEVGNHSINMLKYNNLRNGIYFIELVGKNMNQKAKMYILK